MVPSLGGKYIYGYKELLWMLRRASGIHHALVFYTFFLSFYSRKMTGGRAVAEIKLAGSLVRILVSYKNNLAVNISLIILALGLEIYGVF